MDKASTLEATTKALDAIDQQTAAAVEASEEVVAMVVNNPVVLAGVAIVGLTIGGTGGYYLARKHLEKKFDERLEEEIAQTRAFYKSISKEGKTPEDVAAARDLPVQLGYSVETPAQTEQELLETQKSIATEGAALAETLEDSAAEVRSIFSGTIAEWDQGSEMMKRDANPDDPYIISKEEYMANDDENEQAAWVYFEGDDTLADEREMPIMDVEGTVGEDNLTKFGYGSNDPNVVYVHNPRSGLDIEVVRSKGEYAVEVAGLQHSDSDGRERKFRRSHE